MNPTVTNYIGQTVKYVRNVPDMASKKNNFQEGEGFVIAQFLNADRRPMVQVKDGEHAVNVDLFAVNPSEEFIEAYKAMFAKIDELSNQANAEIKALTDKANADIQDVYTLTIGAPFIVSDKLADQADESDNSATTEA